MSREAALCYGLYHTPSQCRTPPVTLTLTESHRVSHAASHTPDTRFLLLSSGFLAPSRGPCEAWGLPSPRSGFLVLEAPRCPSSV